MAEIHKGTEDEAGGRQPHRGHKIADDDVVEDVEAVDADAVVDAVVVAVVADPFPFALAFAFAFALAVAAAVVDDDDEEDDGRALAMSG